MFFLSTTSIYGIEGKKTNAAEIFHYKMLIDVLPRQKAVSVKAEMDIDFHGQDHVDLYLYKNVKIHHVAFGRKSAEYVFLPDSVSKSLSSRILRIKEPRNRVNKITMIYSLQLDSLANENMMMCHCDSDIVCMTSYFDWYPVTGNDLFTAYMEVTVPKGFKVSGNGRVRQKKNAWIVNRPWKDMEMTLLVSPKLKTRKLELNGRTIDIDYQGLEEKNVDVIASICSESFKFYTSCFGTDRLEGDDEDGYLKLLAVDFSRGAFSRTNFIMTQINLDLLSTLAHEVAHFWWGKAPTENWLDWLNEGFAEFSSWIYIFHSNSHISTDNLRLLREQMKELPPIYGIDRDALDASNVLYYKGGLLLFDLQQEVGDERFYTFMKEVHKRKVTDYKTLMEVTCSILGEKYVEWIDFRLKN